MREITDEVKKVIIGKDEVVDMVFAAILAQGHVLMEDVPGVGKTTLAVAFSKALGLETKRIQFTPDTVASDITGYTAFDRQAQGFTFLDVHIRLLRKKIMELNGEELIKTMRGVGYYVE